MGRCMDGGGWQVLLHPSDGLEMQDTIFRIHTNGVRMDISDCSLISHPRARIQTRC